ncbi:MULTISPECIES: sigma-70 family RNA polymerase sigma factor [Bacteroides]|uniref:sigma-70 family RNA polymerase sigma factor n=1 Tax=Bacteroides TaxID=816 RepID=UPI00189B4882|nr:MULTISPECIES: sigma-70 family RNA polymerase sigma factor [Bacteroides]
MMTVKQIYTEDLQLAKALIKRDELTTRKFFYQQCYPLFKSIFDNYYTDCENCKEFIDEIYLLVLSPSKTTGKCQMENFRGESTLTSWLKSSCLFYCYKKFEIKERMPKYEKITHQNGNNSDNDDRNDSIYGSLELDFSKLNRNDAISLLKQMPNKRYSELIRLRYLEQNTNEETAKALGMTMENYYSKHKLAKEQYQIIQRKEANNG